MIKGLRKYYLLLHTTSTFLKDKTGLASRISEAAKHRKIKLDLSWLNNIREVKLLGVLFCAIGCFIGIYALNIDTHVAVKYYDSNSFNLPKRVNNLALMQQRYDYLITSGIVLIIGVILIVSSKPLQPAPERYTAYYELAKRAEFKGKLEEAIDHYMDTIYYVEEDFISYSEKHLQEKEDFIFRLWTKIDQLKKSVDGEARTSFKKTI